MDLMRMIKMGLVHGWTSTGRLFAILGVCLSVADVFAADPTISLTATPRYPWNGLVDIDFTLTGEETDGGYAVHEPGDDAIAGHRLKYVQSAGDVQLNTGVVPGSKNTIELKFAWDDNPEKVNECLFCARGSTTTTATFTGFLINSRWRFDYNSTTGSTNGVPQATKGVPIVVRDVAGTASVDGITRQSYSATSFTVGGPLTLFASYVGAPGTSTDNHLKGKIYYLKIFGDDGTTLLHDFVPWEKDGVVGMYDTIAARFVAPNVGTLTCGTRGTKYDTSFTAKDVAGGTNLTMKTLYKSNGAAANPAKEPLLPGNYSWVWDAQADLGADTVLERVTVSAETVAPAITYSVKFNANGGTGTMADESFTYGTAKALTANAFTRTGFAFDGWAKSASGTKAYSDKQSVSNLTATAGGTFNLYAVWKATGGVQLWANGPYWAECNVGATKPEQYGYYFWWGDTKGYKRVGSSWNAVDGSKTGFSFRSGNCPTYDMSKSELLSAGYIDSMGNLVAAHDAAATHWGGGWRMPTDAEFGALISNCTTTWTTRNGVYGRLVEGKGDYASKSIFLPAAGYSYGSNLYSLGSNGDYWSSTPYLDNSYLAMYLYFYSGDFDRDYTNRYYGRSVRPLRGFAK